MPISAPQWTEFLTCPVCSRDFTDTQRQPISLGCGHTVCKSCLSSLHRTVCPFDQSAINLEINLLPINYALLQLLGFTIPPPTCPEVPRIKEHKEHYLSSKKYVEELALFLSPLVSKNGSLSEASSSVLTNGALSRPMHRKLVTLVNCQLAEEEGCARMMRAIRSLGERTVLEFILLHQNSAQLSQNLWTAVRNRGCQFLGPAMQEDALKYILLALECGEALSRKVIVLFAVQRLEQMFPHASKTSIGHVVQLLYRASCFKVTKRDDESSLMQLKEQFRTYDALRREHDSQIVQIALEAGLRISPEQWSALLYGDQTHKSHMQSIIDKLQTPESFASSIHELTFALQRSSDPAHLGRLREHFELLSQIDGSPDASVPSWKELEDALKAVAAVVHGLVEFTKAYGCRAKPAMEQPVHSRFKTSMCRDFAHRGSCPRGLNCTFAHSEDELDKYRRKAKAARPNTMVNARGGIPDQMTYSSTNLDELPENSQIARNNSIRTSPLCMQNNGQEYPVATSSFGQLAHRGHSNPSTHDVMVQQLRNLSMHCQPPSMYSGQENGYRNPPMVTDCLTQPHNSEQSFSYPWMNRPNGHVNGHINGHVNGHVNGVVNGHMESVVRPGPTRTSPLSVEKDIILNGVNGISRLNGVNGIMNGHSDYVAAAAAQRRKSELMNYAMNQRFRCAQYVQQPNAYPLHSSQFYPNDVGRYGAVGTRMISDIDRYGYPPYQANSISPRGGTLIDGRIDVLHNPSFHPHIAVEGLYRSRSPYIPDNDIEDTDSAKKTDNNQSSSLFDGSLPSDKESNSRQNLNSVSSAASSGDSFGSHSPRSHSPLGSPRQHSPDAWPSSSDSSSVWFNGDFASFTSSAWAPKKTDELSGWSDSVNERSNEADKESWPKIKKQSTHQALRERDTSSSCSGYWSDPEVTTRYKQIKNDEMIARTLQNDKDALEAGISSSATPLVPDLLEDQESDAAIALELQNIENDEHAAKIEKERMIFEQRKEKDLLKMKQIEEDHQLALRFQNEDNGLRYVDDEESIKLHKRLYKEHLERQKELKGKELYGSPFPDGLTVRKHGIPMFSDAEVIKSIKYPVKVVSRGPKPSPPVCVDVLETFIQ